MWIWLGSNWDLSRLSNSIWGATVRHYRWSGWRALCRSLGMVLLLGTVAVASPPAANAAASLDVFVGYADNLRANPTQFPTPWDGAPDVIFAGCHTGCT